MVKKKILIVFGTRPEAIKMAPVVKEFQKFPEQFETKVCVTAQHREMLDQVLGFFEIKPDFDLDLMKPAQNLSNLTSDILESFSKVLGEYNPDFVYVHGDTTTTFAASLSAFYAGAQVCHVEAGLRTFDKKAPYPEEINRQLTGRLADYHFAPTLQAKQNLLQEGVLDRNIIVTGNTVIDALMYTVEKTKLSNNSEITNLKKIIDSNKKLILVTGHRRENFGKGIRAICEALKEIASRNDVQIIYPVHLNPKVQESVFSLLNGVENIHLIQPLAYEAFVWLMNESYLVVTDSGGIQEEAPSLGKPVLLIRETTERPEAISAGAVILVGTSKQKIIKESILLLEDEVKHKKMSQSKNLYGSGDSANKIVEFQKGV
ncbi:MAG: UDP-N-acetylglucosamine 2-epimerase (non-hydrolyzing) [Balneolaceae bacterium]